MATNKSNFKLLMRIPCEKEYVLIFLKKFPQDNKRKCSVYLTPTSKSSGFTPLTSH